MSGNSSYRSNYSQLIRMAGHNKWSKVKYIKARVDARKGPMSPFTNFEGPEEILIHLEA
ncbi:MAG: hypothetical protein MK194_01670 [Roseibacillus sp.]|nr:hypothetical protein [Roseibacillus sp.]